MPRETTNTLDHWSSAHVVQELGWRPHVPSLPRPGRETRAWRREKFAGWGTGQKAVLVLCEMAHHGLLAGVAAWIGLAELSYGVSLPRQEVLPLAIAVGVAVVAGVQCLVWPPDPSDDGLLGSNPVRGRSGRDEALDDDEDEWDERDEWDEWDDVDPAPTAPSEEPDDRPHPGEVPKSSVRKVFDVVLALFLLPVLGILVVVAFGVMGAGLVVWLAVRRVWPALVVVAVLVVVVPAPSAERVGFTLFVTGIWGMMFAALVLWPLKRWCGLPAPGAGEGPATGEQDMTEEVASTP